MSFSRVTLKKASTDEWSRTTAPEVTGPWTGYVLEKGELALESFADSKLVRMKIGDGITGWGQLPYYVDATSTILRCSEDSVTRTESITLGVSDLTRADGTPIQNQSELLSARLVLIMGSGSSYDMITGIGYVTSVDDSGNLVIVPHKFITSSEVKVPELTVIDGSVW